MLDNAVYKLCWKILSFGISLAAVSNAASASTILDLGWPGSDQGTAAAINASGQVVGYGATYGANGSASAYAAFLYTPGIGAINIGTLGGAWSQPTAINNVGQVAGYSGSISGADLHAFLYTPGAGFTDLGTLGGARSFAQGVNDAGQVVGHSDSPAGTNAAFLYTPGIGMTNLAAPPGFVAATAYGINASGQVVGEVSGASDGNTVIDPFLYTPGIGMTSLGPVIGTGQAFAINNSGQIAGIFWPNNVAFLYTPGIGVTNLGTLGGQNSFAYAMNNVGQVVGSAYTAAGPVGPGDAFIYSNGVMTDLNSLLPPNSGWVLQSAWGINDSGQIAGNGVNPQGQVHAFLLDIGSSSAGTNATSTVLTSSSNPSFSEEPVTFTAAVSPSDATGGVAFSDGSTILGTAPVGNGIASFSISSLAVGSHNITAEYQGDRKYAGSTSSINQEVRALPSPVVVVGANDLEVPVPSGVTLGTPVVFTEGVPSNLLANPDFTLISSATTCTGNPTGGCTVAIQFTPQFAGLRHGAFNLVDTSGNILATYFFSGVGSSPAPAFSVPGAAAATSIYSPAVGYPLGVAVDGAGNAFVVDVYGNQVLEISSGGAVTVVPLGTTLNSPYNVALDAAGNLYIADGGNNRILKLPYGGNTATALHITGLDNPEGVAVDGAGNLYVANTLLPTTDGKGNVIEIVHETGAQKTVVASGLIYPSSLALDAAGDLFIAQKGRNQVLEIPAAGSPVSIGSNLSVAAAVAVDGAGNVFIADQNNGKVVEVAAGAGGPGTGAQTTLASGLLMPNALALDGRGNLFVANIGSGSTSGNILELRNANALQTISFAPIAPQSLGAFPVLTASASSGLPVSFASKTPAICTVSGSTVTLLVSGTCTILASQPGSAVYLPAPALAQSFTVLDSGQTLSATFPVPSGVTLGTPVIFTEGVPSRTLANPDFTLASAGTTCTGNVSGMCTVNVKFTPQFAGLRRGAVKLMDTGNNLVATAYISGVGANSQTPFIPGATKSLSGPGAVSGVAVDGAGHIFFIGGSGLIYESVDGHAIPVPLGTTLNSAFGLALDAAGNLYVGDSGNNRVLELPYGSSTAVALNLPGLTYPQGLAVDGAGNLFIANTRGAASQGNGTVIKLAQGSQIPTTVIGNGLDFPVGLALDGAGDLFVADWGNHRVVEVAASGAWTFIGSGLSYVSGVAVDGVGDVFLLDQNNNRVVEAPGTTNGSGTGAQTTVATGLSQPHGIAVDGQGNIFIADLGTTSSPGGLVEVPKQ